MYPQTSMRTTAFQTTQGSNGETPAVHAGRRHNQGGPSWLSFVAIGTDLIVWQTHDRLQSFLESLLVVRHGDVVKFEPINQTIRRTCIYN